MNVVDCRHDSGRVQAEQHCIWDRHGMRRWLAECGTYSFHDF